MPCPDPCEWSIPALSIHVMNRRNAGDPLFKSKKDRERFLECLENAAARFSLRIHTYCLMGNHYHLLLETIEPNLNKVM